MPKWDLMDRFFPLEGDPAMLRRWRMTVGMTSLSFIILLSSSPIWVPYLLETKASAQEIHEQIKKEVTAVKQELQSVDNSVKEMSRIMQETAEAQAEREREREAREREASIRLLRQQIYETLRDACQASGQVRSLLLQQVDGLKSEFMALTGTEYPQLSCDGF